MAAPARDSFRRFSVLEIHSPISTSLSRSTPVWIPISWKLYQNTTGHSNTSRPDPLSQRCPLRLLRRDILRDRRRSNRTLSVPCRTLSLHSRQPDRMYRGNVRPFSPLEYVVVVVAAESPLAQVFQHRLCLLMIFRNIPSQSLPMPLEGHFLEEWVHHTDTQ